MRSRNLTHCTLTLVHSFSFEPRISTVNFLSSLSLSHMVAMAWARPEWKPGNQEPNQDFPDEWQGLSDLGHHHFLLRSAMSRKLKSEGWGGIKPKNRDMEHWHLNLKARCLHCTFHLIFASLLAHLLIVPVLVTTYSCVYLMDFRWLKKISILSLPFWLEPKKVLGV